MKAASIDLGTIYGRVYLFRGLEAVRFLAPIDQEHLYHETGSMIGTVFGERKRPTVRAFAPSSKAQLEYRRAGHGYPAVVTSHTTERSLETLRGFTFADFEAAVTQDTGSPGFTYEIVTSLGKIEGPLEQVQERIRLANEKAKRESAEAEARRQARDEETEQLKARADALGLYLGFTTETGSFIVQRATVRKLLELAERQA